MTRLIIIIFLICLNAALFSQNKEQYKDHAFSGTILLTAGGGITYGYTDFKDNHLGYLGRGMIEYFFPITKASSFGLRAFGGTGNISGYDNKGASKEFTTDFTFGGGEVVYNHSLGDKVFPYIGVGASYLHFNPKVTILIKIPRNYSYNRSIFNLIGEFGLRVLLLKNISLNLSMLGFINNNDNLDDNFIKTDRKNDMFFTGIAGLSFVILQMR